MVTFLPWVCLREESWDEQVEGRSGPYRGATASLCLALSENSLIPTTWGRWPIAPCSDKMLESELLDSRLFSGPYKESLWLQFPTPSEGLPMPLRDLMSTVCPEV